MATVLYHLHPRGIGGRSAESFTSWVRRLAFRHAVPISRLLNWYVLVPLMNGRRRHQLFDAGTIGESINCRPHLTGLLVQRLEELTGVRALDRTTMLSVPRDLVLASDFRKFRAWCPTCLDVAERDAYDRLSWALVACERCPDCGTRLVDQCSSCGRRHTPWSAQATPTRCPYCGESLAARTSTTESADPVAEVIAEIIGHVQRGLELDPSSVREGMFAVAVESGGAAMLAQRLGLSPRQLRSSIAGRTTVPLGLVARVAATGERSIETLTSATLPVEFKPRGKGRGAARVDRRRILEVLEDELKRGAGLRPLTLLAKQNHWSVETVKSIAPELSAQLVRRYHDERRLMVVKRRNENRALIRRAVSDRQAAGLSVARSAVGQHIGRPWILSEPDANLAYEEALRASKRGAEAD